MGVRIQVVHCSLEYTKEKPKMENGYGYVPNVGTQYKLKFNILYLVISNRIRILVV